MLERAEQPATDRPLGFGFVHAADVDAADADAVGDLVLLRAVVGVTDSDSEEKQRHEGENRDLSLTPHYLSQHRHLPDLT